MRILANPENVNDLFEPTTLQYAYEDDAGVKQVCGMPALKCRACGWASLLGIRNLPFPHECPGFRAVSAATETFGS